MDEWSHLRSRVDVSRWVLHFVRSRRRKDEPGQRDTQSIPIDSDADARTVIVNIVRETALRAGFSHRNGRRTVYGGTPVVCFTEMPLHALMRYAQSRPDNRVGNFAVALLREELFTCGARPVIYGLSAGIAARGAEWLPDLEQYRYVAYQPGRFDWTHEREWRWPARNDDSVSVFDSHRRYCEVPGMYLFGGRFSSVGFVVPNEDVADQLIVELVRLRARGCTDFGVEVIDDVLAASFVVVAEKAAELLERGEVENCSMDGLPASCKYPVRIQLILDSVRSRAKKALADARLAAAAAISAYIEGVQDPMQGPWAFVWVETPDGRRAEVQALIEAEAAHAGESGYIIEVLVGDSPVLSGGPYAPQAKGAEAAAKVLRESLDIEVFVRYRWD